jgi:hypothetical protein
MCLSVRAGLYYRRIAGDYVFLCLRTDRYFLLRGAPVERFDRFLAGEASEADVGWLAARQLVTDTVDDGFIVSKSVPSARSCFLDRPLPRARSGITVATLAAQLRARHELRRRNLADIVADIERAGHGIEKTRLDACLSLAAAFQRSRHYAAAIDRCLVRGLAMKRMLLRRDCEAWFVIGVTMPFSAHCWVQVGDVVLTDPLDMILPFQPILAV